MPRTRRSALALLAGASLAPLLSTRTASIAHAAGTIPITGQALPGLAALDAIVTPILQANAIPGAAIAIAQGGALKLARGYGYADLQANTPMQPQTPIALASVSKVMTAQTVLKMIDAGELHLSDRVFTWFRDLAPPPGMREDPRLAEITIEMCLHHTGGWDRKTSGDPSVWGPRITSALHLDHPPLPLDMIRYMKGVPLDFAPGTRQVYSNFGFVLLGAVAAAVGKQPYPMLVQQHTLHPMGVTGLRIDELPPRYDEGEARRYFMGSRQPLPGGNPRMAMASGGWQASCVDMARVLTAIDGSRTGTPWLSPATMQAMVTPAPGITHPPGRWMGLGWDMVQSFPDPANPGAMRYTWGKDGGLNGIQTYVERMAIGVNYALLFNSGPRVDGGTAGLSLLKPKLIAFIQQTQQARGWPQGDLFPAFA